MHPKFELHRRLWADITSLPADRVLLSSGYPEAEQESVVKYFIALHLRGLAEVRFARSLKIPRVATLFKLTQTGRALQARKERGSTPLKNTARK